MKGKGLKLSVTQLNDYVRRSLASDPLLQGVCVTGELSNLKRHVSGHWYFTLKDEEAAVNCAMFRSAAAGLAFRPENGQRVRVYGSVGLYVKTGSYQLYADAMEPDGLGDLYLRFEALKKKLSAEGLFDPARKQKLPFLPRLGIQMLLPETMDRVMWYGLGPHENYPDMHDSALLGKYAAQVADMHEPYERPQENGARGGTRIVSLIDQLGAGFMAIYEQGFGEGFSFSAHDYTDQALTEAEHTPELEGCGMTVLNIDYRQGGLGSNICGPEPQEKYRAYLKETASFTLVLTPYNRQLGEMMNFARVLPEK